MVKTKFWTHQWKVEDTLDEHHVHNVTPVSALATWLQQFGTIRTRPVATYGSAALPGESLTNYSDYPVRCNLYTAAC